MLGDGHATLNFLFKGGDGERYIGTAGHYILRPPKVEVVWPRDRGPVAFDGGASGSDVSFYGIVDHRPGVTETFSRLSSRLRRVIATSHCRLDRRARANAQTCHFGGPTRMNAATIPATEPTLLHFFGGSLGGFSASTNSWVMPARTGVANGLPDPDRMSFNGFSSIGDSGAPVISEDGGAVALIFGPDDNAMDDGHVGTIGATRFAPQIARAAKVLGTKLRS